VEAEHGVPSFLARDIRDGRFSGPKTTGRSALGERCQKYYSTFRACCSDLSGHGATFGRPPSEFAAATRMPGMLRSDRSVFWRLVRSRDRLPGRAGNEIPGNLGEPGDIPRVSVTEFVSPAQRQPAPCWLTGGNRRAGPEFPRLFLSARQRVGSRHRRPRARASWFTSLDHNRTAGTGCFWLAVCLQWVTSLNGV